MRWLAKPWRYFEAIPDGESPSPPRTPIPASFRGTPCEFWLPLEKYDLASAGMQPVRCSPTFVLDYCDNIGSHVQTCYLQGAS